MGPAASMRNRSVYGAPKSANGMSRTNTLNTKRAADRKEADESRRNNAAKRDRTGEGGEERATGRKGGAGTVRHSFSPPVLPGIQNSQDILQSTFFGYLCLNETLYYGCI